MLVNSQFRVTVIFHNNLLALLGIGEKLFEKDKGNENENRIILEARPKRKCDAKCKALRLARFGPTCCCSNTCERRCDNCNRNERYHSHRSSSHRSSSHRSRTSRGSGRPNRNSCGGSCGHSVECPCPPLPPVVTNRPGRSQHFVINFLNLRFQFDYDASMLAKLL